MCHQKTELVGGKAITLDTTGYKLQHRGKYKTAKEITEYVIGVVTKKDKIIAHKIIIHNELVNIISVCAP